MKGSRRLLVCLLLAGTWVVSMGCSKPAEIQWATVRGSVTVDGQPVPKGKVTYLPTGGTLGPVATTEIKNGQYVCNKVPAGQHNVLLEAEDAEAIEFVDVEGVTRQVPRDILPQHYKAGLPTQVKPGKNKVDFPLSSKVK